MEGDQRLDRYRNVEFSILEFGLVRTKDKPWKSTRMKVPPHKRPPTNVPRMKVEIRGSDQDYWLLMPGFVVTALWLWVLL